MKIDPRLNELLNRLVAVGRPHDKFSCSEFHELFEGVMDLIGDAENIGPLTQQEIMEMANAKIPISPLRALATFALESNWVQIYGGTSSGTYKEKACEWAFIGPIRPPYELAQMALDKVVHKI